MITVFDSSNYAQQVFLREAYATLAAQGNILNPEEIAAGKFLSLDGYFAHMNHLVNVQPKFVMIPSDESPFEINANTRTISVPASFSKCAGVVGDNMCEIVTFTIDRYFDYTDLANARICVQWKLPAKAGEEAEEGISHIGLIDLNTVSGKIRFGWPLTEALTKNAGNISFAVRFYVEKTITDADGEPQTQFVYLFNTLPANIPIREGLNISGEDVVVEQGVTDLFKNFVENSNNPSYPMPTPVTYVKNLDEQDKVDEVSDTLILRAQATTSGDGYIKYDWYLKEGVSDKTDTTAIPMLITNNKYFTVDHEVMDKVAEKDWSKLEKSRQYYINTGSEEAKSFERVVYKYVDGKHTFIKATGEAIPAGTDLYERFTQLTIEPREEGDVSDESKAITGLYHVAARNVVGDEEITVTNEVTTAEGEKVTLTYTVPGINSTPALQSKECYVPTPKEIVIEAKNDLDDNIFIDPVNDAILTVITNPDDGKPQLTYSWYRYNNEDDIENIAGDWVVTKEDAETTLVDTGVLKTSLITEEPGWYFAEIESLLNRATKSTKSNIARIIHHPVKPEIINMKYARWQKDESTGAWKWWTDEDAISWNYLIENKEVKDEDGIIFGDTTADSVLQGDRFRLAIDITALESALVTDGVSFKWFVIEPNKTEGREIDASDIGPNKIIPQGTSLNESYLDVNCPYDGEANSYYCVITNALADETNQIKREDYKVVFTVK